MNSCLYINQLINDGEASIKIKIAESDFLKAVKLIGEDF